MQNSTQLYETLGITPDATPETIKKAYRKKSAEIHPDKHPIEVPETF